MLTIFERCGVSITRSEQPVPAMLFLIVACLLLMSLHATAGPSNVETEHLVVIDEDGRLTQEELRQFALGAQTEYLNILQFWSLTERAGGQDKIILELRREKRGHSFSVFQMENRDGQQRRVVRVFGIGEPQEMVHKLTHALFPTRDKLIRNMMGIPTEQRFGNTLSFPMCGFPADAWVVVLRKTGSFIPLADLGRNHEDWGMSFRAGLPVVFDRKRQHASYAEAGSFGAFLISRFGVEKVKSFYRRPARSGRPWQEVFGADINSLQTQWVSSLEEYSGNNKEQLESLEKLWTDDPATACDRAQQKAVRK